MKRRLSVLTVLLLTIAITTNTYFVSYAGGIDIEEEVEEPAFVPVYIEEEIIEVVDEYDKYDIMAAEYEEKYLEILNMPELQKVKAIKKLDEEYEEIGRSDYVYDIYSEEDILYMQKCIETETHGSDFKSKINVACVILNRVNEYNKTPYEVVTAPGQFTYFRSDISEETILALEYAFLFEDTVNGALFFNSDEKYDSWFGRPYIMTDEAGHNFY